MDRCASKAGPSGRRRPWRRLAKDAGIEDPTDEDLRRFDRGRKGKKVSNKDWQSPTDPDSRIMKMKDGTTHLGYKAEHAVDLDTGVLLAAQVHTGDRADSETVEDTLVAAQRNLNHTKGEPQIEELAADKGYHKAERIAILEAWDVKTYIPERRTKRRRRWADKAEGQKEAVCANRRRTKSTYGKGLQRLRSELVERSFAQTCGSGGARRRRVRGRMGNAKQYLITAAGHNLGAVMRKVFGIGKPRVLQGAAALAAAVETVLGSLTRGHLTLIRVFIRFTSQIRLLTGIDSSIPVSTRTARSAA